MILAIKNHFLYFYTLKLEEINLPMIFSLIGYAGMAEPAYRQAGW